MKPEGSRRIRDNIRKVDNRPPAESRIRSDGDRAGVYEGEPRFDVRISPNVSSVPESAFSTIAAGLAPDAPLLELLVPAAPIGYQRSLDSIYRPKQHQSPRSW
jgi:hypothetical protein